VKAVLVGPAEPEKDEVDEVSERAVHVADVAVVGGALRDCPGDVLEDPLVASERLQGCASGGLLDPREARERDDRRDDEEATGAQDHG
jgi:hypothetical protein